MAQGNIITAARFIFGITLLSIYDKKKSIIQKLASALRPPEKIDLDVWADRYYQLPKETSSEFGQWKTSRFPFLRRPMKCLSPSSRCREMSVVKGAQLGFTEILKAWICYIADHAPAPTMYIQKTKEAAEDFSTQKLDPTIEVTPRLRDTLGPNKPKGLKNDVFNKGFPGGFVVMGGANSGAFLRSKSIAYAGVDEEDSFKANIDGEGSPVAMVRKRQSNFPFSKMGRISTPKFTETSTIDKAFKDGSQERYYVPCPVCNHKADPNGTFFIIGWNKRRNSGSYLSWDKDDNKKPIMDKEGAAPTGIHLVCQTCNGKIKEHKKTWMLENGKWMSEKGSPGFPYEVGDVEKPTFQISSLYSPLGFFSWRSAVMEWFEYVQKSDKALLQVFINQTLGETYSAAGQDISSNWLLERREKYPADVPAGALVITAGVDVQGDRVEVDVTAWGLADQSWAVAYRVFYGDPGLEGDQHGMDAMGHPTVWTQLDEFLMSTFRHESGAIMPIECTLIDSRYNTDNVNSFCLVREHRRIFPSLGRDGWGKGTYERPKRRCEKHKTWKFTLWVDELKDTVYSLLQIAAPGPGYQHFPEKDEYTIKYFHGLTSESKKLKRVNGTPVIYWDCPDHVRNEPLDCRGYALGALRVYSPNLEYRASLDTPTPYIDKTAIGAEAYKPPPKVVTKKPIPRNRRKKTSVAKLF